MTDHSSDKFEQEEGFSTVKEVTGEQKEQFSQRIKQAQAALAAMQKDEGKAKQKDGTMAGLLSHFIRARQDPVLIKLLVKLLEQSVSIELILAALTLIYPELKGDKAGKKSEKPVKLTVPEKLKLVDSVQTELWDWFAELAAVTQKKETRLLKGLILDGKPNSTLTHLLSYLLEKYLLSHEVSFEKKELFDWAGAVLKQIIKKS